MGYFEWIEWISQFRDYENRYQRLLDQLDIDEEELNYCILVVGLVQLSKEHSMEVLPEIKVMYDNALERIRNSKERVRNSKT